LQGFAIKQATFLQKQYHKTTQKPRKCWEIMVFQGGANVGSVKGHKKNIVVLQLYSLYIYPRNLSYIMQTIGSSSKDKRKSIGSDRCMVLKNKKIILGITGSIAASKCLALIKLLLLGGVQLKVLLTEAAEQFISLDDRRQIHDLVQIHLAKDLFGSEKDMLHIDLARFAEIILIAPASANFIAKLTCGFADDLLSSVCLASAARIIVAPAMNQQMWHNHFTQANICKLQTANIDCIGPEEGLQACGDYGYGRMQEPKEIITILEDLTASSEVLSGKTILVTAGPTVERIDAVRYISNFSSGNMGYRVAEAAERLGGKVRLISGPTSLQSPFNMQVEQVTSAQEMHDCVLKFIDQADIYISCAAIADYTPLRIHQKKLKKQQEKIELTLKPTTDIIKEVAKRKNKTFLVGFAAETDDLLTYAHKKLDDKNLDMIVANDVSNGAVFGDDNNQVYIITKRHQQPIHITKRSKKNIAENILRYIAEELAL
jgi:phosphopantothenoylcysteine decarboxylase / phosphopantothenate---cysteine ligase